MNNQNQEKHQDDSNKKESTDQDDVAATSSAPPPPKDVLHSDVCAICQDDVSMMDVATFTFCTGCGKCMHMMCGHDLLSSNLSLETRNSCPMCRAKNVPPGSKEEIKRLRRWSQKKKRWAQFMLGWRYNEGVGVPQDD